MKTLVFVLLILILTPGYSLEPLSESELQSIHGQYSPSGISNLYDHLIDALQNDHSDPMNDEAAVRETLEVLINVTGLLFPAIYMLEADLEIEGVYIAESRLQPLIAPAGELHLVLPNRIERISFRNIRPVGQIGSANFGDIHFEGVEFSDDATLTIRLR